MLNIKIKKIHQDAKLPFKGSQHAGAWDVYATEIVKESEDCYVAKLGWALEFDPKYKLMIAPRSGITRTKWNIQNTPGIGDADFRGEYSIRFRAFPEKVKHNGRFQKSKLVYPNFPYKIGERVAQVYFQEIIQVHWFETQNLNGTERGSGAYGSTGLK